MGGGVVGDVKRLEALVRNLRALDSPRIRTRISQRLAASAIKLTQDCFAGERDPYGVKWLPLKRERRRNKIARRRQERRWAKAGHKPSAAERESLRDKILQDTGRLRSSVAGKNASHGPWGFRLTVPVKYAAVHQYGATIKPGLRRLAKAIVVYRNARTRRFMSARAAARGVTGASGFKVSQRNMGGHTIPARPFLPTKDRGLPPPWLEAFRNDVRSVLAEVLIGKPAPAEGAK